MAKTILDQSWDDIDVEISEHLGISLDVMKSKIPYSKSTIKIFLDQDINKNSYDYLYENFRYLDLPGYLKTLSIASVDKRSKYLLQLSKRVRLKGKRVLDFGCGTGAHGIFCAQMGAEVDFLDIDGPLRKFAEWRAKKRNLNAKFMGPGNLQETYDVIICLDVLEHLASPSVAFVELDKHLKRGGYMLLEVSNMIKPSSGHFSKSILDWNKNKKALLKGYKKISNLLVKI